MPIDNFPAGTTVRVRALFKDEAGALQDPNTVQFIIDGPGGAAVTYTYPQAPVVRNAQGDYQALIQCNDVGDWVATVKSMDSSPVLEKVEVQKWAITSLPVSA